ncbi:MAG TPA: hypothetical protein VNQ79_02780, partial [Blastocatellia bacterium]|nr:hypothetical protein [Blastocatellia bacterium]
LAFDRFQGDLHLESGGVSFSLLLFHNAPDRQRFYTLINGLNFWEHHSQQMRNRRFFDQR